MGIQGGEASLIRAGAKAIANWRQQNPGANIAAQGIVAADIDLSGANLSAANLAGGKFTRCNFRHASFACANLQAAKFDNCLLEDVDFRGANLKAVFISAINLDGSRFGGSLTLGRIAKLHISNRVLRPIIVEYKDLSWYDEWVGWDRLRFMATIRIFIPAYTSLTLTVIYLNGAVWYNRAIGLLNMQFERAGAQPGTSSILPLTPTWTHALILANFVCLALAATCFLACPARVVEFSRERWLNELQQPEILYDHATWQRPLTRLLCASALLIGGLMSAFLLGRAILQQAAFIIHHIQ